MICIKEGFDPTTPVESKSYVESCEIVDQFHNTYVAMDAAAKNCIKVVFSKEAVFYSSESPGWEFEITSNTWHEFKQLCFDILTLTFDAEW